MKDFDWTNVYWIARDSDSSLYLYTKEPLLHPDYMDAYYAEDDMCGAYELPNDMFEDITFNNSPKMIRLSFEEIK